MSYLSFFQRLDYLQGIQRRFWEKIKMRFFFDILYVRSDYRLKEMQKRLELKCDKKVVGQGNVMEEFEV